MTFLEDLLSCKALPSDFDDYADLWKESEIIDLSTFLGFSDDEYAFIVEGSPLYLEDRIKEVVDRYRVEKIASTLQKVKDIIDRFN